LEFRRVLFRSLSLLCEAIQQNHQFTIVEKAKHSPNIRSQLNPCFIKPIRPNKHFQIIARHSFERFNGFNYFKYFVLNLYGLLLKEFTKVILKFNNFADFLIHDANVTYNLLFSKFISGMGWEWVMYSNGLRVCAVADLKHFPVRLVQSFLEAQTFDLPLNPLLPHTRCACCTI